ncbi:anthrone oxygenase family protein [Micromonospora sp. NPDC003197]
MALLQVAVLIAATITTGLIAGLFYAYACSVMPGLRRTDDRTFVTAMRQINEAILNGWFAGIFVGAPVLTTAAVVLHLPTAGRPVLPWLIAALLLNTTTIAITFGINVPLNNDLAAGNPNSATLATIREKFEAKWVRWNIVRAATPTAALACLTWALVLYGRLGSP